MATVLTFLFVCLFVLHCQETLTGFKWMGNKADELRKEGKTVLFAFEEAIGEIWTEGS